MTSPPIVHRAEGSPPAVALSFDDGPSEWTLAIASAVEDQAGRATFFVRGEAVDEWPDVPAELAQRGHELGNHLWSHTAADELGEAEIRAELERTSDALERRAGVSPTLVRPPYLSAPGRVALAVRGSTVSRVVLASVVPEDWRLESAEEIAERVLTAIGPGDIVCLHDGMPRGSGGTPTRAPTVAAVGRLLPALRARGLDAVTVSELLR